MFVYGTTQPLHIDELISAKDPHVTYLHLRNLISHCQKFMVHVYKRGSTNQIKTINSSNQTTVLHHGGQ